MLGMINGHGLGEQLFTDTGVTKIFKMNHPLNIKRAKNRIFPLSANGGSLSL